MKRKAKKGPGRPPKITAAVVEEVGKLMALGVPEEFACEMHGVNAETFGPAVSRNPEFKRIMKLHHAEFMVEALTAIKEGGKRVKIAVGLDNDGKQAFEEQRIPWTGLAWILERRYKPHYNKTEVHKPGEGKGESGGLMTVDEMQALERMTKAIVADMDSTAKGKK